MEILKIRYQLSEDEINESLLCLNYRREGIFRNVNLCVASILGAAVLLAYMRQPEQFFLVLLLFVIILLLFYMAYGPAYARRRRAKKLAGQKGEYRLTITDSLIFYGDQNEKIQLKEKALKLKFYVSDRMYTLKAGREIFAIPRRALSGEAEKQLSELMRGLRAELININIKR